MWEMLQDEAAEFGGEVVPAGSGPVPGTMPVV